MGLAGEEQQCERCATLEQRVSRLLHCVQSMNAHIVQLQWEK